MRKRMIVRRLKFTSVSGCAIRVVGVDATNLFDDYSLQGSVKKGIRQRRYIGTNRNEYSDKMCKIWSEIVF